MDEGAYDGDAFEIIVRIELWEANAQESVLLFVEDENNKEMARTPRTRATTLSSNTGSFSFNLNRGTATVKSTPFFPRSTPANASSKEISSAEETWTAIAVRKTSSGDDEGVALRGYERGE